MSSTRDVVLRKLELFYQKYDPAKATERKLDQLAKFAMTEGLEALNENLLRKYGDYLDSGTDEYLMDDGYNERDALRLSIEIYYLLHDPSKLSVPEDIDAILEWAMFHGIDKLNAKLEDKYKHRLEDATVERASAFVGQYYKERNVEKTAVELESLVNWGVENSFVELNRKLIEKYGIAFGETEEHPEEKIEVKLKEFYAIYDPAKLDDLDSLKYVVSWAMKNGEKRLNEMLQAKYGANLNTMVVPQPQASNDSHNQSEKPKAARKIKEGALIKEEEDAYSREIAAVVEADEKKLERIRKLVEIYYGKHDPNRLLEEGVSGVIQFALVKGEESLNEKLRGKYNEDLQDIEAEYNEILLKLKRFYEMYDPSKLAPGIEITVGRTIIRGYTWLNKKLMQKYDDDTDFTGFKARLRVFYQKVKADKTEVQISNIADWALEKGIDKLNKKMKKKYGVSLEDTFFGEAPVEEELFETEYEEEEFTEDDDDDVSSEYLHTEEKGNLPPQQPLLDLFGPESDQDTDSYEDDDVLDGLEFTDDEASEPRGRSSFLAIEEEKEDDDTKVDLVSDNIVKKIQTFYQRHDPEYGAKPGNIGKDVEFVLQHGVEAYNARLIVKYGESLRSILGRKHTLAQFKKVQIMKEKKKSMRAASKQGKKKKKKTKTGRFTKLRGMV